MRMEFLPKPISLTMSRVLILLFSFLIACGEVGEEGGEGGEGGEEGNEVSAVQTQGWHFQGRNCLGCHNVDLKPERHLLMAGTVFKSKDVSNPDDLSQACGGVYIQLIDQFGNIYNSRLRNDPNSKGYKGKGNVFFLMRNLNNVSGGYTVRIIDEKGNTLAKSGDLSHTFNSIFNYDPRNNPTDANNRFSCNACHKYPNPQGGAPGFIYPNVNPNLCK